MSLTRVQRRVLRPLYSSAAQNVVGHLYFNGPTVVELDPSAFPRVGEYVIFKYGSFNPSQLPNLLVDDNDLQNMNSFYVLAGPTDYPSNKFITITISNIL